ncbi:MAG: prepilin-type N-terminal cleavage/methylation domain-containing protein [Elusimicrobiota bacterium]
MSSKGFTLVEVLISAAIGAFLILVVVHFFFVFNKGRMSSEAYRLCSQEADLVMQTMTNELEKAGSNLTGTSLFTTVPAVSVIAQPAALNNNWLVFFSQDVDTNTVVSVLDYWVKYYTENYRIVREVRRGGTNIWSMLSPLSPPIKTYLTSPMVRVEALTFKIYDSNDIATVDNTSASQIEITLTLRNLDRFFIGKRRVLLKAVLFGGG